MDMKRLCTPQMILLSPPMMLLWLGIGQTRIVHPCKGDTRYTVVDMSIPTHKIKTKSGESALKLLQAFGVKTVFRYYDYEQESIPGKTLSLDERDAIFSANLSVAVIFQHNNDNPATFVVGNRGADDARRALTLAKRLGQPFGTAIYFGVDAWMAWMIGWKIL
jgi:hypothetical protein